MLRDGLKREIWILDLERGGLRPISTEGISLFPLWSRDGSYLIYYANRGGGEGISRRRADGSGEEERLLETPTRPVPLDWGPNDRGLVFVENGPTWLFSDGEASELSLEPQWLGSLRFSPDGRVVAFDGWEQDEYHVFVQPFPSSGQRIEVSIGARHPRGRFAGGRNPRWGPDGKELFYQVDGGLFVAEVETEPELRIGTPELLFEGDFALYFDVSPDGQRFLMRSAGPWVVPQELQVVINWIEELERLAPHPQR